MARGDTHESQASVTHVKVGSDRAFGCVFAVVFAVAGFYPVLDAGPVRWWCLAVAAVFLIAALTRPAVLHPLNRLWFRFGLLLHRVVTPVVMGLMFFLTVTPVGLLMRATGKDPLRLKRDAAATSYWIVRQPPGPAASSMKNQF